MFDFLTKLFEGKNINRKMTLRNQLNYVKIQNAETIQSYFTRVSQIKEQLEAVDEEEENTEIVMTTLNGKLWEECSQEEAWIAAREEKMGSEDQALTVHSKKTRRSSHHPIGMHSHKDNTRKDLSRIRCYTCDEKGHFA